MSKEIDHSRRLFIKSGVAATISAALPIKVHSFTQNTCSQRSNSSLLKFAHLTDTHIGDVANPIRADLLGGSIAFFYERPQDFMSPKLLDATIQSINSAAMKMGMDFCMATGDLIDMSMKREVEWLVDIADGKSLRNYRPESMIPLPDPAGMRLQWYGCLGNHDLLLFGSLPSRLVEYAVLKVNDNPDFDIILQDEWIEAVVNSTTPVNGHGFLFQPEENDGYYSFSPSAGIHCIVLNTTADNFMEGLADRFISENQTRLSFITGRSSRLNDVFRKLTREYTRWILREGLDSIIRDHELFQTQTDDLNAVMAMGSSGTLDKDQYEWMTNEIEANRDKLCIIFSHHGSCNFVNIPGNINQETFDQTLCKYENVIAHVCGHSHKNCIENITLSNNSYYRIRTSSLIEYPQEWRSIEILRTGDAKGTIQCRMFRHDYAEAYMVAANHWRVQSSKEDNYGDANDRDVDLVFDIPSAVVNNLTTGSYDAVSA